ncbi:DUF5067 domain-containing protein [Shouchella clausii]
MGIIGGALCLSGMVLIVLSFIPLIRDIKNKEKRASKTSLKLAGPGLIALILGIIIIPADRETQQAEEPETVTASTEKKEEEKEDPESAHDEKKEPFNKEIELSDEFSFRDFSVEMKKANIYEENESVYLELSFNWRNHFEEEAKFIRAASVWATQDGQELEETTNAYSDTSSDVHFPNAAGGLWGVDLTFELLNDSPVQIVFMPHNDGEENKEFTINIE